MSFITPPEYHYMKEAYMFNYYNQPNNNANNNQRNSNQAQAYDFQTLQNARRDLIGEIQAIIDYDDHLHSTNIDAARATWQNIRDEEMVHVGELLGLLYYLAPYQKQFVEQGLDEFNERMNNKNM